MNQPKNLGWVKTPRQLLYEPIFQDPHLFRIYMWCMFKATHTVHPVLIGRQTVILKPGQFVFGRKKAGQELGIPPSTFRGYLYALKSIGFIDIKPDTKFSIATVCHWVTNESGEENSRQQIEQQMDTYKNGKEGLQEGYKNCIAVYSENTDGLDNKIKERLEQEENDPNFVPF